MAIRINDAAFRELMDELGYRYVAELARHMGLTRACLSRIFNHNRTPSAKFIAAFRSAFPTRSLDYYFIFDPPVTGQCHPARNASASARPRRGRPRRPRADSSVAGRAC